MSSGRFSVLIAGGGVAGLEALLALRDLAGDRVDLRLLAPEAEFVYRPMAVGEPFGRGRPDRRAAGGYRVGLRGRVGPGGARRG